MKKLRLNREIVMKLQVARGSEVGSAVATWACPPIVPRTEPVLKYSLMDSYC